jgi:hypothetical protein
MFIILTLIIAAAFNLVSTLRDGGDRQASGYVFILDVWRTSATISAKNFAVQGAMVGMIGNRIRRGGWVLLVPQCVGRSPS